jgi:hypothetical protein
MKLIAGMNYRQWQKRNTEQFNSLTKSQQKEARQQGYCNIGWNKVQKSWRIIYKLAINVPTLFEYKLRKGDIIGAIELSILEAERTKRLARQALETLEKKQQYLGKVADKTLAKYSLL